MELAVEGDGGGVECSVQAVGLQGLVAMGSHGQYRTPEVCGHGSGTSRARGFAQKISPARIFGSGRLYMRMAGIGAF